MSVVYHFLAFHIGDDTARFLDEQIACRDIPGGENAFKEDVVSACRNVGKVECCRTGSAKVTALQIKCVCKLEGFFAECVLVVGGCAERYDGMREISFGNLNFSAV